MTHIEGSAEWADEKIKALKDEFLKYGIESFFAYNHKGIENNKSTMGLTYSNPISAVGLCQISNGMIMSNYEGRQED